MRRTLLICLCATLVASLFSHAGAVTAITSTRSNDAPAQGADAAEISKIEAHARQLDRYTKTSRGRYFAGTASEEEQNPRWREFKTKREFDKAETYSAATVWVKPTGEVAVANFSLSSPSGDWAMYNTYYYRADGTLAKLRSELRTFMGDVIVMRDRLYDTTGKMIQEKVRYLDLNTRKPKRVKEGDYMAMPLEVYAKSSDLPFYKLMNNR
jgi:hypothetical protein